MEDLLEKKITAMMRTNVSEDDICMVLQQCGLWNTRAQGSLENISGWHMLKQSVMELSTLKDLKRF